MRLRTSVILLLVGTMLVTLAIVGSGILAVMANRIAGENQARAAEAAAEMAKRLEIFLGDVRSRVELAGSLYARVPAEALPKLLDRAREPTLDAIYVIDAAGRLVAASIAGSSEARTRELTGIDLSAYPFFQNAIRSGMAHWSDKHLSGVTGAVTMGLAVPITDRTGVIIAELSLQTLLDISAIGRDKGVLDYWVVDSKGEVVADSNPADTEKINLYNLPVVAAGFAGSTLPREMTFHGTNYHVSASYSRTLGWLFVSRVPAGLKNPRFREIVAVVLIVLFGSVGVGLLLAPLWAQGIVRPLKAVADSAHLIANGSQPEVWPRGSIAELNGLSDDLGRMASAIAQRQEELRRLNDDLESRVARRTEELKRSNLELSGALATVEKAKDELIQSEKLAALGRLVAGVAHELNTPLGNGRMAVTGLTDRLSRFERSLAEGLKRSELDAFIAGVRTSIDIAERNMRRASELISSFKQVATDRAASRRRKFVLREIVDEVLLTLSPLMKHLPIELQVDVPSGLLLDSYPGELGQVLTNLVENSVRHGFNGRDGGRISVEASLGTDGLVLLRLCDDGTGMAPDVARRAFDPFFTTALGQGGSGLGLFITHNSVTNVLGGTISLQSDPATGTCFELRLPQIAPTVDAQDDGSGARV